jgi:hypothetical protein
VHRDGLVVRPWYQPDDYLNEYREEVVRLKGLQTLTAGGDSHILTRVNQWKLVPKQAVGLEVDLQDANAASWSSDNNCTDPPKCNLNPVLPSGEIDHWNSS